MATAPYFVLSPNTVLSLIGLVHGPDKTVPTPPEDWRDATVDVVIPALDEEHHVALCLASVARQTFLPRRIVLIDDGSEDRTLEMAEEFCRQNGMELMAVHRHHPIGKTPTIKRQARELDSDVEFILDADTVLESDDYIERTVEELYKAKGIASACGTILPMREKDRRRMIELPEMKRFRAAVPGATNGIRDGWLHRLDQGLTNLYRDTLYFYLQRVIYRGEMYFFGTIANPVGCAVAYRRKYVEDLFDRYEPIFGDDLTNSEDIFIGFAMLDKGYRNVQLSDVVARSTEPEAHRLPRQLYLWSSAFLQSCYYFDGLLRSPLRALRRYRKERRSHREFASPEEDHRKIHEPYRQAFGRRHTRTFGRPIGWVLLMAAVEKIGFPLALLTMVLLGLWWPLALTVMIETAVSVTILTVVAKGHRLEYFFKGLAVTPLRYASLFYDLFTLGRFAADLWIFKDRRWRK